MVTYGLINLTYLYHYHVVLTELELVTVIVGISGQEAFKSGHVFWSWCSLRECSCWDANLNRLLYKAMCLWSCVQSVEISSGDVCRTSRLIDLLSVTFYGIRGSTAAALYTDPVISTALSNDSSHVISFRLCTTPMHGQTPCSEAAVLL